MHLGLTELLEFYHAHRTDEALVLGTVHPIQKPPSLDNAPKPVHRHRKTFIYLEW